MEEVFEANIRPNHCSNCRNCLVCRLDTDLVVYCKLGERDHKDRMLIPYYAVVREKAPMQFVRKDRCKFEDMDYEPILPVT